MSIADAYPPSDQQLSYETDDSVLFFSGPFDPLNNWSPHQIKLWGQTFPTVEHGFHWRKFSDNEPELAAKILAAPSPYAAFKLAKQYKNRRRTDWNIAKVGIMGELIQSKATQHVDVRDMLLATGHKTIVENSPWDNFWGGGPNGDGQNHTGKLLMQARDTLRREAHL